MLDLSALKRLPPNKRITGQCFAISGRKDPAGTDRELIAISVMIAVPQGHQIKDQHQHVIVGEVLEDGSLELRIDAGSHIDLTDMKLDLGSAFNQDIWRT